MSDFGLDLEKVAPLLKLALIEDIGTGDVTSELVAPPALSARMSFVARQTAVIAGLPLLKPIFHEISRAVTVEQQVQDADHVQPGQVIAVASGPAHALLAGERLVLNFLQRLSGIATITHAFVQAVAGTSAQIYDTRKTTPGLRLLEKYAVRVGGGCNHRMGLYDQVLIKDNHLHCLAQSSGSGALDDLVARTREHLPGILIEIEVEDFDMLETALNAGADVLLLDNMSPEQLVRAVSRVRSRPHPPLLESSGGVTLQNVARIAASGVDRISIGQLTHSAPAVDVAADLHDIHRTQEKP